MKYPDTGGSTETTPHIREGAGIRKKSVMS